MVTADPAEAVAAVAGGGTAVLIVPANGLAPILPAASPARSLAVMVGDPADPAVWAAATEMEGELHAATLRGREPHAATQTGREPHAATQMVTGSHAHGSASDS